MNKKLLGWKPASPCFCLVLALAFFMACPFAADAQHWFERKDVGRRKIVGDLTKFNEEYRLAMGRVPSIGYAPGSNPLDQLIWPESTASGPPKLQRIYEPVLIFTEFNRGSLPEGTRVSIIADYVQFMDYKGKLDPGRERNMTAMGQIRTIYHWHIVPKTTKRGVWKKKGDRWVTAQ